MERGKVKEHESYGMLQINRFSGGGSEFFGSDLAHNGGISFSVSRAEKETNLNTDWYHSKSEIIRVELSNSQFIDAITSGMNTTGVPCTIKRFDNKAVEQISHVEDKRDEFSNNMAETQLEFKNKIDGILEKLEGNIGKRKAADIKHDLEVLRNHISSNTPFVLKCFNEAMEKTVSEAKHSISSYIDHKVHTLGIEGMRKEIQISIEKE